MHVHHQHVTLDVHIVRVRAQPPLARPPTQPDRRLIVDPMNCPVVTRQGTPRTTSDGLGSGWRRPGQRWRRGRARVFAVKASSLYIDAFDAI